MSIPETVGKLSESLKIVCLLAGSVRLEAPDVELRANASMILGLSQSLRPAQCCGPDGLNRAVEIAEERSLVSGLLNLLAGGCRVLV